MKRFALLSILFALILVTSPVYAVTCNIGAGVALKADYIHFTDSNISDLLNAEDGYYVGFEAYKQLFIPNFYLGVESGYARSTNGEDSNQLFVTANELTYVPIELNAKYVFSINPCLNVDIGAGVSYNYFEVEIENFFGHISDHDWVFGGQFFLDINYVIMENFFVGIGAKYQLTDDSSIFGINDTNLNNIRAGVQIGYNF